ncbi:MAG: hypothetical protein KAH03_00555, partial [Cocleimonas sp.]|nr:hypothetical protein [Cocleimonas sp.]
MVRVRYSLIGFLSIFILINLLSGCISPDNDVIEGMGTPDVTECSIIPGVGDGAEYSPRDATRLDLDNDAD